jgi:hypothetical protein
MVQEMHRKGTPPTAGINVVKKEKPAFVMQAQFYCFRDITDVLRTLSEWGAMHRETMKKSLRKRKPAR